MSEQEFSGWYILLPEYWKECTLEKESWSTLYR